MLQPRNRNRAEYLKSDRIKTLDLPENSTLPNIAKDLEAAKQFPIFDDIPSIERLESHAQDTADQQPFTAVNSPHL